MENKFPDRIMRPLRQRLGLEPDDTSRDNEINLYSKSEALDEVCEWEGLCGYGYIIRKWIKDIYGVELDMDGVILHASTNRTRIDYD